MNIAGIIMLKSEMVPMISSENIASIDDNTMVDDDASFARHDVVPNRSVEYQKNTNYQPSYSKQHSSFNNGNKYNKFRSSTSSSRNESPRSEYTKTSPTEWSTASYSRKSKYKKSQDQQPVPDCDRFNSLQDKIIHHNKSKKNIKSCQNLSDYLITLESRISEMKILIEKIKTEIVQITMDA